MNIQPSTESAKPVSSIRLHYLDGIRGLACLYVLLTHIWCYAYTWVSVPPHVPVYLKWLDYGHLGVTIFITLSGFCLMLPFASPRFEIEPRWKRKFFFRRAWRILPPYYFAGLASMAIEVLRPEVLSNHVTTLKTTIAPGIVSHLLLFQDFFGVSQINYAHWSVALEWQIYFLFPVLLYLLSRLPLYTVVASVTGLFFAFRFLLDQTQMAPWQFAIQFVASFTIGMAGAKLAFSGASTTSLTNAAKGSGFIVGLIFISLFTLPHALNYLSEELAVSVASAVLMVFLAKNPVSPLASLFELKPFVFIGTMSYSLYLMYAPLLDFVGASLIRTRNMAPTSEFLLLLTVGAPTVVAASYVFYLCCEKPFMKWRPRTMASFMERLELWQFDRSFQLVNKKFIVE